MTRRTSAPKPPNPVKKGVQFGSTVAAKAGRVVNLGPCPDPGHNKDFQRDIGTIGYIGRDGQTVCWGCWQRQEKEAEP